VCGVVFVGVGDQIGLCPLEKSLEMPIMSFALEKKKSPTLSESAVN
jgi:hypothetical protein